MKPIRWGAMPTMMLAASAGRAVPAAAIAAARRISMPSTLLQYACDGWATTHRIHHWPKKRRRHQVALSSTIRGIDASREATICNGFGNGFVEEVISFLNADGIPWRRLAHHELRHVLSNATISTDRVDEMLALLEDRALLAVGAVKNDTDTSNWPPYAFILHLCPAPNLQSMQMTHQKHQTNASISQTVTAYAWLNAHLTNAFFNYDSNNPQSSEENTSGKPRISVVHLHQDVWRRSPEIVRSRLRSKTGMFQSRVYARKTVAKRIPKSQFLPFLEENHLWGATGAKYGYGLFLKPTKKGDAGQLIAIATFSSKRKVKRASHEFHSFELLRFCTAMDTTVVGGLTKLVAAFVKDMKKKQSDRSNSDSIEMDIITSIDRDFGGNTWPKFDRMDLMDPVPMFVGEDGMRRHAVGAGLAPLELEQDTSSMTTSTLLRSGLPESVLQQLEQDETADGDSPWQVAANAGFHPVFDAGVERLMTVVGSDKTEQLSASELWEKSTPRYVKEHYSPNAGIESMLTCIRGAKNQ